METRASEASAGREEGSVLCARGWPCLEPMLWEKFIIAVWCRYWNFQDVKQTHKREIGIVKEAMSRARRSDGPGDPRAAEKMSPVVTVMPSWRGPKKTLKRSDVRLIQIHD